MFKQTFVLGFFLVVTLVGYSAVEAGKDKPSQKQDVGPGDMVDIKKKDKRPEKWCCYKRLSDYASADGFGDVLFKSLLRPEKFLNNQTICPPKAQNPVLTNVLKCLKRCAINPVNQLSTEGQYASWLLKAFKFTRLACEKNFTEASDHLYKIAQDKVVKHECTTEVSYMLSNLNLDPSSLDNFKQSCVDRDVALTCIKEHHVKNEGLVNETTLYLQGLLATFYYILEAKAIADGTPHDHSNDADVRKCLVEMKDIMGYLEGTADVPPIEVETEPPPKPEPESSTETTVPSQDSTTTTSQSTDVSGPSSTDSPKKPTGDGNNNSTGNSGISIKCFHGFDRLPILAAALAVVVRMALAVAVDGS
ncbi:hypothetical protein Ddc_09904 [Ditylenchus destructor]|nr:hypothetical protein Ddc_09904 [Ditylenchus destructor]